ncbi:type VI secretion system baseplate subunit TssE [Archangium lansingense]|uniref:Type VI secretion system baseplate subunit TssE n=1 Tax=Archangium lansingense TaxID=2995310 RepID=A0ABT4A0M7_9BACT|nr:type VI secretion system baseplate subunit TssE [Archangium lansinium]MCY1075146.1 type VI secretion system baseplate subunit TssE [Archangium lansinium]
MVRRPFLDKLLGDKPGPQAHDELAQVIRNIEAVLNTQEGYGYFRRDFGLGDYTGKRGTSALVKTLTEELQEEIERYEPRLRDVEVKMLGRDATLWLHFELTAMLRGTPLTLQLLFDTVSSRVRIQRKE